MVDIAFSGTRLVRSLALEWQESVFVTRDISALIAEGTVRVTAQQMSEAVRRSVSKMLEYEAAELMELTESYASVDSCSMPLAAMPQQLHAVHFQTVELFTSDALILSAAKLCKFDRVRLLFSLQKDSACNRAFGYAIRSGSSEKFLDLNMTHGFSLNVSLRN